jgi:hypothetical protein
MTNLTQAEIVEKWAHIAMKLFPPQMEITPASRSGGWAICARWKAAEDGRSMPRNREKGVDLWFSEEAVTVYREADVDTQLKWDAFIENCVNERLQSLDTDVQGSADPAVEKWVIPLGGSRRM